ncbi:MAG: cupin domain-containing protein [Solirubrobacterales bacterium]|nr:cupin domain-containing protein [Solirubrobacterales bacterium]
MTFVEESPERLVMDVVWPRPGHRAAEHVHPSQEERWTVLEGRAAFAIGGVEHEAGPGETVVAPAGVRHLAWNPTDAPVRLRVELAPALRWRSFVERLFAGEDPVALLAEFADEVRRP